MGEVFKGNFNWSFLKFHLDQYRIVTIIHNLNGFMWFLQGTCNGWLLCLERACTEYPRDNFPVKWHPYPHGHEIRVNSYQQWIKRGQSVKLTIVFKPAYSYKIATIINILVITLIHCQFFIKVLNTHWKIILVTYKESWRHKYRLYSRVL